jgi:hypothetical protein
MLISVVNYSTLREEEVQKALRAINRQIAEDFQPYWSFGAQLRLEGGIGRAPSEDQLAELRGEAILYLYDHVTIPDALGYHDGNARGIPYGFVFTELTKQLGESWTVTLSHEALELIADPLVNLLTQGPHPNEPNRDVFHWFEMCDAVQAETYVLDGVEVSNFVLPAYFTVGDELGTRNDFLGRKDADGKSLQSFGVKPGGYVGYFDPVSQSHETWSRAGDSQAMARMNAKAAMSAGRGVGRKSSGSRLAK